MANVAYPDLYQHFLDCVNLLNLDLGWLPSVGCIVDFGFHQRLLISTSGPLLAMVLLAGTFLHAMRRHGTVCEEAAHIIRWKYLSAVLLLTFLVYSSASATVFQTFACECLHDGNEYLRADYRIQCDSPTHRGWQLYAAFMVVVYPVGIPVAYSILLSRHRRRLTNMRSREHDARIRPILQLWAPYRPSRYYYEIVECVRRISLTGVVVFIYPNTAAQVAITLAMAFAFVLVSEGLSPYASQWDRWISRAGHVIVFLSMYVALLLKVDATNERSESQKLLAGVLVAANVCMVVAVVFEAIAMMGSVRQSGTSASPRDTRTARHPRQLLGSKRARRRPHEQELVPVK